MKLCISISPNVIYIIVLKVCMHIAISFSIVYKSNSFNYCQIILTTISK